MSTIHLKTKEDIDKLIHAIINDDEFIIGEVTPIKYKLVLDGGRFENFDPKIINVDIAKIILSIQSNYDTLLDELNDKYDIKIDDDVRKLNFTIDKGSGVIETILESEVIKTMKSKHVMYVFAVSIIAFTAYEGYSLHMESLNKKIENDKEIELKKIEKADRKDERESAEKRFDKLLDITKELSYNRVIQDSVNKPKRDVLSTLNSNEYIKVSKDIKITSAEKAKYNYRKPDLDDIETIVEETHRIETYNFLKEGKVFKLEGIPKSASSEVLEASKRLKLIQKANTQDYVKLKLKVVKDPSTKKTKKIFILDYLEN